MNRPLATAALLTVILLAQFLLFIPATLYVGNVNEFGSALPAILRSYSLIALPLLAVILLAFALVPARHRVYATTFVALLAIVL